MRFGLNFFPCVDPAEKSAEQYFREALHLAGLTDELGYSHVRQVEHYFKPYGGYSPNPLIFLTAVAQRTTKVRLITGAVLPAFNSPLKMAGEIGMLDGISAGRLEVGFARAFLPHEFAQFGVSLDESRRRFTEGLAQITMLLSAENVSSKGEFHSFTNVTSLPRPDPARAGQDAKLDRRLSRSVASGGQSRQRPRHEHVLHVLRADARGSDGDRLGTLQRPISRASHWRRRNGSPAPAPRTIRAMTS
jgi:hypothetical protein